MSIRRVANAWIADTARVLGDVTLGDDVSVWYGTVIRGDVAPIVVGARTNVQDLTMLHCDTDEPLVIGPDVSIGHSAVVHCAEVGEGTLVGIGAKVLAGARVGKGCIVAAGAVVPPGAVVPDGKVVMGLPAKVVRAVSAKEKAYITMIPPHYVGLARRHVEHPDARDVRPFGAPAGAEADMATARTIDEYLAGLDPERRAALEKIRRAIRAAAPDAEECISYGMPAFRRGKVIAGFAACADHGSYYPFSGTTIAALGDALKGYRGTKSAVHFPWERPLPDPLVRKLVKARIAEVGRPARKPRRGS